MASPQKENGFTPIANEILEALSRTPLSDYESRIIFALFRKTYGYHKKNDWISDSQFIQMVDIHKSHFSRTKKRLIERKIVTYLGNRIAFNKDYEMWLEKDGVTNLGLKVTNLGNQKLPNEADTKDIKIITKEIAETSSALEAKKKKMKTYDENNPYQEPSIDIDTREISEAKKQPSKYPNSKKIFNLFGKYPANWKINKTQLQSAENLFIERGVEQILRAINFYRENKEDEFCPIINSPYDLDSKWAKLIGFKKKQ